MISQVTDRDEIHHDARHVDPSTSHIQTKIEESLMRMNEFIKLGQLDEVLREAEAVPSSIEMFGGLKAHYFRILGTAYQQLYRFEKASELDLPRFNRQVIRSWWGCIDC